MSTLCKSGKTASFIDNNNNSVVLRWVPSYKHVGTKSCIADEVVSRCAIMRKSFNSLRKSVFRNCHVPLRNKLIILQVYIMTKGTFQCGTWPALSVEHMRKFSSCILGIYREVSGHSFDKINPDKSICDADLLFQYDLVSPETILRVSRLMLFARVCLKGPDFLSSMIESIVSCIDSWPLWSLTTSNG